MAKRSDGIETRNRILGAAARLFSEKGFRQTSNADISRASGVNSALISYYFGDKETIYREAWRHSLRAALEKYLPADWKVLHSEGGMFCFVFGPDGLDEAKFQEACYANKVGLVPSVAFSASGKPLGGFRMCFTPMTPEQIEEGCRRFGETARNFKN